MPGELDMLNYDPTRDPGAAQPAPAQPSAEPASPAATYDIGGQKVTAAEVATWRDAHGREQQVKDYDAQLRAYTGQLKEAARGIEDYHTFSQALEKDPKAVIERLLGAFNIDPASLTAGQKRELAREAQAATHQQQAAERQGAPPPAGGIPPEVLERLGQIENYLGQSAQAAQAQGTLAAFDQAIEGGFGGFDKRAMDSIKTVAYAYRFPGQLDEAAALQKAREDLLYFVLHPEQLPDDVRREAEKVWMESYRTAAEQRRNLTRNQLTGPGGAKGPSSGKTKYDKLSPLDALEQMGADYDTGELDL